MTKLGDFIPQLPAISSKIGALGELMFLSKARENAGEGYKTPSFGVDRIVSNYVRQQYAYRFRLLQDVYLIATTISEIAAPINHITSEVFRRGINWTSKFASKCEDCGTEYNEIHEECDKCKSTNLREPDEKQKERLDAFRRDCNIFDQSLEDVLRSLHRAVNTYDDAFLYLVKEYVPNDPKTVRSKVIEIRDLNPALVEFDLDAQGLPKNAHFVCYLHREGQPESEPGLCSECGRPLIPAMYRYWHRGAARYLLDSEIVHFSKFFPSVSYGWPPVLCIFEKALTILGADRCYDEDTEVLTSAGWKRFRDIESADAFATLGKNDQLEYAPASNFHKYWHDGDAYRLATKQLDFLVSPNHRMYVCKYDPHKTKFALKEAKDIVGLKYAYKRGGVIWEGKHEQTFVLPITHLPQRGPFLKDVRFPTGVWASFLGCWYATGRVDKNAISFPTNKLSNNWMGFADALPIDWLRDSRRWRGCCRPLKDYLKRFYPSKETLLAELVDWPKEMKSAFADAAIKSFRDVQTYKVRNTRLWDALQNFVASLSLESSTSKAIDEFVVIHPVEYKLSQEIPIDMDIWLEFLGYYLSEGSCRVSGAVQISQTTPDKREIIKKCLSKLPFKWGEYEEAFVCHSRPLADYLSRFGKAKDKFIPKEVLSLCREQLQILFDALMLGDGSVGRRYTTTSPRLRDDIMEVAVKLGCGVSYVQRKRTNPNWATTYNVEISKKRLLAKANNGRKDDSWVKYNGWMYCVEVPNSTLLVRRNGKVAWSGNSMYRWFFERRMPASMLLVSTDDPESLRRERAILAAEMKNDPDYIPMVAVSNKTSRGRVDMVRLFHTFQEMQYLDIRREIRERIAEMWGVTPIWQSSSEAMGGLNTQSQQLVVMSRVVESDQRLFHEKVFPVLLEAFGVTDWLLELSQPEEIAESTRLQFAQQKTAVANQLFQMGFDVELKSTGTGIQDIDFVISGEAKKPPDPFGGGMFDGGGGGGLGGGETPTQPFGGGEDEGAPFGEEPPTAEEGLNLMNDAGKDDWLNQISLSGYESPGITKVSKNGQVQFISKGEKYLARFTKDGRLRGIQKQEELPPPAYDPHNESKPMERLPKLPPY